MVDTSENRAGHCTTDDLVLYAQGEPVGSAEFPSHLAACGSCQADADQWRAVVATTRSVTPADRLIAPPPTLWAGVTQAIREDEVVPLRRRGVPAGRSRLATWSAVAAAAVLVASITVVAPWRDDAPPAAVASPAISLTPLGTSSAVGAAYMASTGSGGLMTVDVPDLPASDGFYEVWLMGGPDQLISLGVLDSRNHGAFPVPAGVDVSAFPYIDISLEALDGNPAHSGDSVVRGTLPA